MYILVFYLKIGQYAGIWKINDNVLWDLSQPTLYNVQQAS